LSDLPRRKVFKIHGSTFNVGSIVATTRDYERAYRSLSRNVLGATLKHLLATKSVLFVGYSFGDSDLNRIYRFMRREMPDVLPRSYIVTPDAPPDHSLEQATIIRTDGTYFLKMLKEELLPRGCLLPDDRYESLEATFDDVLRRHHELYYRFEARRVPAVVHSGHYQDGLIHAFERMLERRRTGEYSHVCHVEHLVRAYEDHRKELVRAKRYHDAAYVTGYPNGLLYLISDARARKALPLYFVYGSSEELRSITAFKREARRAQDLHKQAFAQARRLASMIGPGMVLSHRPEV